MKTAKELKAMISHKEKILKVTIERGIPFPYYIMSLQAEIYILKLILK